MRKVEFVLIICAYLFAERCTLAQHSEQLELQAKITVLCEDSKNWYLISTSDSIVLEYIGKFTTNTIKGARQIMKKELRKPESNRLEISLKCMQNWSDSSFIKVKADNENYLSFLKKEYTAHLDSVGWPPRLSRRQLDENPLTYLGMFELKTDSVFLKIKRLPDFRINDIGVFYDTNIDFSIYYIVQASVRAEIVQFLIRVAGLDTHIENAIDGKQNY